MDDLGGSLTNLSARLADLGRREEALAAMQEPPTSTGSWPWPDPEAFQADLGTSLSNLAVRLGELERREEALAAIEEAVTIRRELASARPDAFLPDLATALNNLSGRLGDAGRRRRGWPRSGRPLRPTGSWPRPARTRSGLPPR